jgi:hypothetical protein
VRQTLGKWNSFSAGVTHGRATTLARKSSMIVEKIAKRRASSPDFNSDIARLIEAPTAPPQHDFDLTLTEALCNYLNPALSSRKSYLQTAVSRCIELKEDVCLEWLSRHHDTGQVEQFQPDGKVALPLLNATDLAWVCKWIGERKLPVPIEFHLEIGKLESSDEALGRIAEMLASPGLIASLTLRKGCQTFTVMQALAGLIKLNRGLRTLHINMPDVDLEGIHELADALKFNTALRTLIFTDLQCKEGGFSELCSALAENSGLEVFSLVDSVVSNREVQPLCALIKANKLEALDLSYTRFETPFEPSAAKKMWSKTKKTLNSLGKGKTKHPLPPDGLVLEAITANRSLRRLALIGWGIDTLCARRLVPLLKDSRFCELKIGPILAKGSKYEAIFELLKASLDENRSLCVFDSDGPELCKYGNAQAARNRERIRSSASAGVCRLAANLEVPIAIPGDAADLIVSMLSRSSQLALSVATKPTTD